MNVYAMKQEVTICDNCKKSIANEKCDICNGDICKSARCRINEEIKFSIKNKSGVNSLLCKITYCAKCKKTSYWIGELSEDMRDIICSKIKARKMLNAVEKDND